MLRLPRHRHPTTLPWNRTAKGFRSLVIRLSLDGVCSRADRGVCPRTASVRFKRNFLKAAGAVFYLTFL
jgi:hypothetical protein